MPSLITPLPVTRADLDRVFPKNPKMVLAFEGLFRRTADNTIAVTTGAESTQALNDATVLTLSPNATLNNERVLAFDPQSLTVTDNGAGNTLAIAGRVKVTGIFRCTLSLAADTNVSLPAGGRIPSSEDGPYADDTAAAAAGVEIGEWYAKTGGTVAWRQT